MICSPHQVNSKHLRKESRNRSLCFLTPVSTVSLENKQSLMWSEVIKGFYYCLKADTFDKYTLCHSVVHLCGNQKEAGCF